MTLAFEAQYISCADAMGGEILQVTFDTISEDQGEEGRRTPYVLIGCNFEFYDSVAIEWHDGRDYEGGAKILAVTLSRTCILIKLDQELDIDVTFCLSDRKFTQLTSFLRMMIDDDRIAFTD